MDDARRGRSYDVTRHGEYRDNRRVTTRAICGRSATASKPATTRATGCTAIREVATRRHPPIRTRLHRPRLIRVSKGRITALTADATHHRRRRTAIATASRKASTLPTTATASIQSARSDIVKATTTTRSSTDRATSTSANTAQRSSRGTTKAIAVIARSFERAWRRVLDPPPHSSNFETRSQFSIRPRNRLIRSTSRCGVSAGVVEEPCARA